MLSQPTQSVESHRAQLISSHELHKRSVINKLCNAFIEVSMSPKTTEIENLVEKIFVTAIKFGQQRSRLQMFTANNNEIVSTLARDQFEDLNQSNREAIAEGRVLLAVHPGLLRQGDGQGRAFSQVTRIRAAGVYLEEI
jgi:hypothetical protein